MCHIEGGWLGKNLDSIRLFIPYGATERGELVSPQEASKGEPYFCPACGSRLVLKQGQIKAFHFAHKAESACNQESILHKTAKGLIRKVIEDWKSGAGSSPVIERICPGCYAKIRQAIPGKVESVQEEYRLESFIADVALIGGGAPLAAIEIRVTHAVDESKQLNLPVPFIELDGLEVIENPTLWRPITDRFKPVKCRKCEAKAKRIGELARVSKIEFAPFYKPDITKCYRCKREIIYFDWEARGIFPEQLPQELPRPWTVQNRYSKTLGGRYWANTCPHCKAIQGDYFLFMEPH